MKNGKNIAEKFFVDYDGKELAKEVSDFVNPFFYDREGFIERIKEEKDKTPILNIVLLWLIKLEFLEDNNYYDERNKCSIEAGNQLRGVLSDKVVYVSSLFKYKGIIDHKDYENNNSINKEILFVETMGRDHRTLQQSFSSLIFETLTLFPEIQDKIKSLNEFWKLPLI